MNNSSILPNAEVIAVFPNKVKISVDDLSKFSTVDSQLEKLRVGSYLEVADDEDHKLIVIIESYSIEYSDEKITDDEGNDRILKNKKYVIDANPLGAIVNGKFQRGGEALTIPPTKVKPASQEDILSIYNSGVTDDNSFTFSRLLTDRSICVPVNGNKFFNKHFAIVGSTGSGKSHAVSKVLQLAADSRSGTYKGLNNSHVILFDIHGEYQSAFPKANYVDIDNLILPYWLLNSEELSELFIDTDSNDHNQRSAFQEAVTVNKKFHYKGDSNRKDRLNYDSPSFFKLSEVLRYLKYRNTETKQKDNSINYENTIDESDSFVFSESTRERLFEENLESKMGKTKGTATGTLNGKFINFINRLEIKLADRRLDFLLGEQSKIITFQETLMQFLGMNDKPEKENTNITIIDLSGIPFEVLSITVSLISRIIFEFGFYSKKISTNNVCETPILLIYEEAHKYVPKSDLLKFRSSKFAIERIAKEGRKYGITLGIVSQRPSEISETIFSQCNNFIAMRLTNPEDQNYVKRLLPDTMGNITDILPILKAGDALLVGESITIPSLVHIDLCDPNPDSSDIKFLELWKEEWKDFDFVNVINKWTK